MDKNSIEAGIFFMWQQEMLNQANKQFLDSPLNQLLPQCKSRKSNIFSYASQKRLIKYLGYMLSR